MHETRQRSLHMNISSILLKATTFFAVSFTKNPSFVTEAFVSNKSAPLSQSFFKRHNKDFTTTSNLLFCAPSSDYSANSNANTNTNTNTNTNNQQQISAMMKENEENNPLTSLALPETLILGSGSFTRKLILKEMNIPFVLKVKPINEYEIGTRDDDSHAHSLVLTLAKAKADALIKGLIQCNESSQISNGNDAAAAAANDKFNLNLSNYSESSEYLVLTADQVVTCNGDILEKPQSLEQAKQFIRE